MRLADGNKCMTEGSDTGWKELTTHSRTMEEVEKHRQQCCDWLGSSGLFFFFFCCGPWSCQSILLTFCPDCLLEQAGVKLPRALFTSHPSSSLLALHKATQAPLFQVAERLLWRWLSWCWCSVLKLVEEGVAAVTVEWEVHRIQPGSGRGKVGVDCRSWAACAGRLGSRKQQQQQEEEEWRWWWEQRWDGPGISRTLSSSSRIFPRPPPLSPLPCLLKLLWHLQPSTMRSSGGSCVRCTLSTMFSRMGQLSAGTRCRKYARGEKDTLISLHLTFSHICISTVADKPFISFFSDFLQALWWHLTRKACWEMGTMT